MLFFQANLLSAISKQAYFFYSSDLYSSKMKAARCGGSRDPMSRKNNMRQPSGLHTKSPTCLRLVLLGPPTSSWLLLRRNTRSGIYGVPSTSRLDEGIGRVRPQHWPKWLQEVHREALFYVDTVLHVCIENYIVLNC
jgi:hypothetical protein